MHVALKKAREIREGVIGVILTGVTGISAPLYSHQYVPSVLLSPEFLHPA